MRVGLITAALGAAGLAAAQAPPQLEERDLASSVVAGLGADATNVAKVASAIAGAINATIPTATVTSFPQATSALASAFAQGANFLEAAPALIQAGFNPEDIEDIAKGFSPETNSINNKNPKKPSKTIYPKASSADAPYSLPEASLRAGIYIPPSFTYGKKPPVILFPGTGVEGGMIYSYTYGRVLQDKSFADPLWVNIPKFLLDDAQVTAEYAAYAMNYIAGISNRNVSIVTFSQGSLNVQWALKYWPSTRNVTSNFIALSPDYHGTVNAALLCPAFPNAGCTPSVLQQKDTSTFVKTLLANRGDSAYVPTTNIRSATDEIVQPQTGSNPSGVLKDARNVGVTNVLVQDTCPASPAGTFVTHEGMLYNALAYALATDALKNGGPGRVSSVDLPKVCSMVVAEGMSLNDLIAVESSFVVFITNFLTYMPRVFKEPAIKAYAA